MALPPPPSSSVSTPIIIELGSSSIKVGIAGETQPKCIFPSLNSTCCASYNCDATTYSKALAVKTLPPLPHTSIPLPTNKNSEYDNEEDENGISSFYYSILSPFLHSLFTQHLHLKHTYPTGGTSTNSTSISSASSTKPKLQSSLLQHSSSKMKKIIILLPTYYPQSYIQTIQYIFHHEFHIPKNDKFIKFIPKSNLYTTLPFALGKSIGIVVDIYNTGVFDRSGKSSSTGSGEVGITIGAYFDKRVLDDTIVSTHIHKLMLIQNVYEKVMDSFNLSEENVKGDDNDNNDGSNKYYDMIANLVEDVLSSQDTSMSSTTTIHLSSQIINRNEINEIIHQCIYDLYFNIDNPQSLLYTFLECIIKCPIDLRLELIRNVCFTGDGVTNGLLPKSSHLEKEFLIVIQNLFEKVEGISNEESIQYKITDQHHHGKFQCLANLLMVKGPLTLIYPLPFSPLCISWVGGSVYGMLNSLH